MISTITTATTEIVTTAAATSLALIAVLTLISLLIQKEIVSGLDGVRAKRLGRAVNVVLIPLVVVFVTSFVVMAGNVLR